MDNLLQESKNVNNQKLEPDDLIEFFEDGLEKDQQLRAEVNVQAQEPKTSIKSSTKPAQAKATPAKENKATGKAPATKAKKETTKETKAAKPADKDADKGSSTAKEKAPTVDYVFVNQKDTQGRLIVNNYRREGSLVFKWTGEYWKEQSEELIKGYIAFWLKTNYPTEFFARNLNSIFTMFINSIPMFAKKKIDGIIVPTRHHWLRLDEKTGEFEAILPDREQPVKYIIDVIVPAEGKFELPTPPLAFPPAKSKWEKFIESSLPETDVRARVQEFSGYTLTNSTRKQLMFWMLGKGANGKSVYVSCLTRLHANPVSVKLAEIAQYNAHLIPASLVYATETPKKGFDEEFIKAAVAGDNVELRAIYGKKQNAELTAKWIFLMNDLPMITDFSDGLTRRINIVHWNQQFLGDKADENLVHDITTSNEEMESVLYWCLEGLQRMVKNNWKFTEAETISKAMSEWKNAADKVRLFFVERNYHYDENKKIKTDKQSLFEAFNKWADFNNFERMSSTGFWMRTNNIFPRLKEDPDMKDKNTGRRACYLYVKAQDI
ncbi:SF3 helicase domain-containing protein [Burkholderia cenocepacia]|uniref:phage/plasmid primase, P4 family n=1 Tax=Burkholderia cenocepacia TaxID=95486 RepID=UPI00192BE01E|nr:phage/plasmid primase, P4 family [Burkholderia cenocepacia]CAD9227880.1 SF3 helicase domain-containing protein [Burkholderia cenocepacia]